MKQADLRRASPTEVTSLFGRSAFEQLLASPRQAAMVVFEVMHTRGTPTRTARRPPIAEALLRVAWRGSDGEMLAIRPDLLIEQSRTVDSSGKLTARVEAMAIDLAAADIDRVLAHHQDLWLTVNVSAKELAAHSVLRRSVVDAARRFGSSSRARRIAGVAHHGADRHARRSPVLVVELSEDHLGDAATAARQTQWLHRAGTKVFLDDVLDGEASLAKVSEILAVGGKVDAIKLSRSHTLDYLDAAREKHDEMQKLLAQCVDLCNEHGLVLVMEGVEQPELLAARMVNQGLNVRTCLFQGHAWGGWAGQPSHAHAGAHRAVGIPIATNGFGAPHVFTRAPVADLAG